MLVLVGSPDATPRLLDESKHRFSFGKGSFMAPSLPLRGKSHFCSNVVCSFGATGPAYLANLQNKRGNESLVGRQCTYAAPGTSSLPRLDSVLKPTLNRRRRGGGCRISSCLVLEAFGLLDKSPPCLFTQCGDASRRSIPPWAFRCRPSTVRLVIFNSFLRVRPKTLPF